MSVAPPKGRAGSGGHHFAPHVLKDSGSVNDDHAINEDGGGVGADGGRPGAANVNADENGGADAVIVAHVSADDEGGSVGRDAAGGNDAGNGVGSGCAGCLIAPRHSISMVHRAPAQG